MSPRPRFIADGMLGSLARWLRIMGYDTVYERDRADGEMLRRAQEEGRTLLTRDQELAARGAPGSVHVRSEDLDEQLGQLVAEMGLSAEGEMTRCTTCNGPLEVVGKESLEGVVPKGALDSHDEFYRCASCGKAYWKGSHWTNIRKRLDELEARAGRSPR
ncbi:MAG: Mut7-C RNAse domain-containing protein [Methanomassiliicoccales archaeon]|jgi:hypothetical protein|nr:Mut7-C RNAse domain-containing protein [Methanomassiliicoccales archaeon]